jgi:hypothetical protein
MPGSIPFVANTRALSSSSKESDPTPRYPSVFAKLVTALRTAVIVSDAIPNTGD